MQPSCVWGVINGYVTEDIRGYTPVDVISTIAPCTAATDIVDWRRLPVLTL